MTIIRDNPLISVTLCISRARQAGFGHKLSFQGSTCFNNKIRDADRQTQKGESKSWHIPSVHMNSWGESCLFSNHFLSASRLLSISFTMSFSSPSTAHSRFPPPPASSSLHLCFMHHLSFLALDAHSCSISLISCFLQTNKSQNISPSRCYL